MDDATRAELAELRRRAFGPDPDIAADPAAMDRLVELESLVLDEQAALTAARMPALVTAGDARAAGRPHIGEEAATPADAPEASPPAADGAPAARPPRRGLRLAITVALGFAVVIGGAQVTADLSGIAEPSASPAPGDVVAPLPAGAVLIEIPLDRSLARYVEPSPPPSFPVPEDLQWTSMLGTYYGWDLWLARSRSGFPCILVTRDGESQGQCVPEQVFLDSTLGVAVAYADIDPEIRPPGMTATERIEYWWLPQRGVVVMRGGGSITYFGRDD